MSFEELSKFHRGVIRATNSELSCLIRQDGSRTEPGEDTLNEIIKMHFPKYTKTKERQHSNKIVAKTELKETAKTWITSDLIKIAMDGFQAKKLPGPDGYKPVIFKYLPDNTIETLEPVSYTHLTLPTIYSV